MSNRLLKNAHLRRYPCLLAGPSSLRHLRCLTPQNFGGLASGHFWASCENCLFSKLL